VCSFAKTIVLVASLWVYLLLPVLLLPALSLWVYLLLLVLSPWVYLLLLVASQWAYLLLLVLDHAIRGWVFV